MEEVAEPRLPKRSELVLKRAPQKRTRRVYVQQCNKISDSWRTLADVEKLETGAEHTRFESHIATLNSTC